MQNLFYPLEQLYKFLYLSVYDITGDYGIALILLSLFIYIILFPFNQKAQQIQNEEREVQSIIAPQIEEIKKHFHGKEQYEKIQRLYRRYAYHPIYAIRSAAGIVLQIPFFVAARSMLYALPDIKGVQWGILQDLGKPDQLLAGINLLPFVMTFVTVLYAFVMPKLSKKEITQTIIIGFIFLIILYPAPSALLIFWTWNLLWSLLHCLFFDRLQWFNEYIERVRDFVAENELAFHIIFALVLTVGLFVPSEIYIKNASQLWFDYKEILKYFLVDTAKYFLILLFMYVFCWRKKIKGIYLSLLLGILFGVFLQSYIISLDYGLFDGHDIEWEKYTKDGIVNAFIWLICVYVTFAIFKRLKFDLGRIKNYAKPVAFGIVVIQCVVLLLTLKNNPIQKDILYEDGKAGILTTKNLYEVSTKDNIIVFLLDAFDAAVFEEIQQNHLEVLKNFKDFTYYPDTTSSFGFTLYSLPEILTGSHFNPSIIKYPDFLNEAWNNNPYYKILQERNYKVSLYTSGNFVAKYAPVDNLITEKVAMTHTIADKFNNLVKFRIVPHCLKKLYYQYDSDVQTSMIQNKGIKPYEINDSKFYNDLQAGLQLNEKQNCFQFYHLQGVHYPWILDENLEPIKEGEKGSASKAALGRLKIVNEYLTQLQSHSLYDNATIVVLADHGYNHMLGRRPLFMIKQPNAHNDYLQTSNRPSMLAELMPFICKRFDQKVHKSNEDIIGYERDRFFYYEEADSGFCKYKIKRNAKEQTSWVALGKIEQYRGGDRKYHIGDVIDFSSFGNSNRYKGKGWSINPTIGYSDIAQFESDLVLDIAGDLKDSEYIFKMKVHPILSAFNLPYKTITLYANDRKVGYWKFEKDKFEEVKCNIPKTILSERLLTLRFVVDVPESFKNDDGVKVNVKFVVDKMQIVKD